MADKKPKRAIAELEALNFQIRGTLESGRNTYWSIVKFESDENFNRGQVWHLHITFDENPNLSQDKFIVTVGLVAGEEGPEHFLHKGSRFELIGNDLKTVKAKGVIIKLL